MAERGIALKLLGTSLDWDIRYNIEIIAAYSRTYHNLFSDGLTRNSVEKVEAMASETVLTRVEAPELLYISRNSVSPDDLSPELHMPNSHHTCDPGVNVVEWGPS